MSLLLSESCVYTIRHSDFLREIVEQGGKGSFTENTRWAKGYDVLQEAKAAGLQVPVLFGHAEDTSNGVTHWGLIDVITRSGPSTDIEFSGLRELQSPIPLRRLRKLSDSKPISENHIHPYVPCHTPSKLAGLPLANQRAVASQPKFTFGAGMQYTRAEVATLIGLPKEKSKGGDWATGYTFQNGAWFVFCGVGIPGQTGHDYKNQIDGQNLIWWGKTNTRLAQPQISKLLSGKYPVYVFARFEKRGSFRFLGIGSPVDIHDGPPVRATWTFESLPDVAPPSETVPESDEFREKVRNLRKRGFESPPKGNAKPTKVVTTTTGFVRDHNVVAYVEIRAKGTCEWCEAKSPFLRPDKSPYLEVHHIKPLAEGGADAIENTAALCPNCHRECHSGELAAILQVELAAKIAKRFKIH